jgi:hypothetical protein
MAEDEDDPARQFWDYLNRWVENDNKQRALRPAVVRMLGTATWQVGAMDALRAESPEMARELNGDIARGLADLEFRLPLPREYDTKTDVSSSAVTAAVNVSVYSALVSARGSDAQSSPRLTAEIDRYEEIVAEQGRADEAGRRVALLFPNLSERFTAAQNAVRVAGGNSQAQESAASDMRTFLWKLKGELFSRASKHVGENMTWEFMAERLGTAGQRVLLDQGSTYSSLIDTLSKICKARSSTFNFDEVWTRFVDHVFIVCGEVIVGTPP